MSGWSVLSHRGQAGSGGPGGDATAQIAPGSVLMLISRAHVVDFDALTELALAGRFKAAPPYAPMNSSLRAWLRPGPSLAHAPSRPVLT